MREKIHGIIRTPGGRNRAVDVLRGIAILWIVTEHATVGFDIDYTFGINGFLYKLERSTDIPLGIFLFLSGYFAMRATEADSFSVRSYFARRAERIFPPYFILLLLAIALVRVYPLPSYTKAGTYPPHRTYKVLEVRPGGVFVSPDVDAPIFWAGDFPGVKTGDTLHDTEPYFHQRVTQPYRPDVRLGRYFTLTQLYLGNSDSFFLIAHTWFISAIVQLYLAVGIAAFLAGYVTSDPARKRILYLVLIASALAWTRFSPLPRVGVFHTALLGCALAVTEPWWSARLGGLRKWRIPGILAALGLMLLAFILYLRPVPFSREQDLVLLAVVFLGTGAILSPAAAGGLPGVRIVELMGHRSYGIYLWHGSLQIAAFSMLKGRFALDPLALWAVIFTALPIAIGIGIEMLLERAIRSRRQKSS